MNSSQNTPPPLYSTTPPLHKELMNEVILRPQAKSPSPKVLPARIPKEELMKEVVMALLQRGMSNSAGVDQLLGFHAV